MKARAAVLEEFNKPLSIKEFDTVPPGKEETLIKIQAAGVCGSDVHMIDGKDPRTPLPIILGHEGVGTIKDIAAGRKDINGRPLGKGDMVIWDRGITCGNCYFCKTKKKTYLCPDRQVYGISFTSSEPPHLLGCYSEYVHLLSGTKLMKIEEDSDPATLVAASCSGATAAHTLELSHLDKGDTVVIQGPGPLGIFAIAFANERGAKNIVVTGSSASRRRLEISKKFGATEMLLRDESSFEERIKHIRDITDGRGAEVVIECSGSPRALTEGIQMVAPGGIYLIPGIATPTGDIPFEMYQDVSRKNVSIQGVWVSDTSHLHKAVKLILSKKYPFEKMVTHTFGLKEINEALETVRSRKALKAVIVP